MKKLFLFLFFSIHAHANYLEDNFKPPEILEILRTCFSEYYDCKFLLKMNGDKKSLVLLIGENHENPYEALAQGRMLFEYFDHFGYESGIGRHFNFLPKCIREPAIISAKASGYGKIWGHKIPYTPGHSLLTEKLPNKFDIEEDCPSAYNFSTAKKDAALSILLSSVLGSLFCWQHQDVYPLVAGVTTGLVGSIVSIAKGIDEAIGKDYLGNFLLVRDANMARNINKFIFQKSINSCQKFFFATGAAHLYGITKNLVIFHDFEDHTDDLLSTYQSFRNDYWEVLYRDTRYRDLTKLSGSFYGSILQLILKDYKDSPLRPICGVDY